VIKVCQVKCRKHELSKILLASRETNTIYNKLAWFFFRLGCTELEIQ